MSPKRNLTCDFFVVETVLLRLYVLVFIEHSTRRLHLPCGDNSVEHVDITPHRKLQGQDRYCVVVLCDGAVIAEIVGREVTEEAITAAMSSVS
jgi:hypothetical protein